MYFPQTDKYLDNTFGFEDFWQKNGGLPIFGYPITGATGVEDGKVFQYFERARFERRVTPTYQPLPGSTVELGLLGVAYLRLVADLKECLNRKPYYHVTVGNKGT